jgi:hypothetical protein
LLLPPCGAHHVVVLKVGQAARSQPAQIGQFWAHRFRGVIGSPCYFSVAAVFGTCEAPYREVGQLLRSMMPAFVGQIVPRFPIID